MSNYLCTDLIIHKQTKTKKSMNANCEKKSFFCPKLYLTDLSSLFCQCVRCKKQTLLMILKKNNRQANKGIS